MARYSLGSKQSAGFSASRWAKGPRKRPSAARGATCPDGQKGDLIKSSLNCRNPPGHGTCACADHDNVHVRSSRSHRLGREIGKSERWREYLDARACSYRLAQRVKWHERCETASRPAEPLMTCSTSDVAVCCSRASFSSRVSRATSPSLPAAEEVGRDASCGRGTRFGFNALGRPALAGLPLTVERLPAADMPRSEHDRSAVLAGFARA
jgi:hypothetical protein